MKRTCATSSGFTQCAGSFVLIGALNGDVRVSRGLNSFETRASSRSSKPVPGMPDVRQALLPVVVHAKQQRAEVLTRLPRLRPAADDELLLLDELELPPGGAAPARLIGRARIFDDQAFPPFCGWRARAARGRR